MHSRMLHNNSSKRLIQTILIRSEKRLSGSCPSPSSWSMISPSSYWSRRGGTSTPPQNLSSNWSSCTPSCSNPRRRIWRRIGNVTIKVSSSWEKQLLKWLRSRLRSRRSRSKLKSRRMKLMRSHKWLVWRRVKSRSRMLKPTSKLTNVESSRRTLSTRRHQRRQIWMQLSPSLSRLRQHWEVSRRKISK